MGEGAKPAKRAVYRFGAFELRTETGELFQYGIRIRLQIKPLQILEALLNQPGQLVTREELRNKLWLAGTFVDFESGLNTATNRLRAALKDSADSPRYIETLPRLGYRFICPVDKLSDNDTKPEASEIADTSPVFQETLSAAEDTMMRLPQRSMPSWLRKPYRATLDNTVALAIAVVFVSLHLDTNPRHQSSSFRQLSFRAGLVESARFVAGTNNAIYTSIEGDWGQRTLFVNLDGSNSKILDGGSGELVAVSRQGDLAMLQSASPLGSSRLLRISEHGQPVSMLAQDLRGADWFPDGRQIALVSAHGTESQIEFPAGHVVYRSSAFISSLRVSPNAEKVAFLEHPIRDDDQGFPVIVDRHGNSQVLTKLWSSADGLAWSPTGKEVWFTAARTGASRALYAVSTSGNLRLISNTPTSMRLFDISRTGRILIALDDIHTTMAARLANDSEEEDVTKFDESHVDDISSDGQLILFTEGGNAGGYHYSAYTFDQQSRQAVRFAAGRGFALSPDKNSALTIDPRERNSFMLTNLRTRECRKVQGEGFEYQWAKFFPDGRRVLVGGAYPGQRFQICVQSVDGGKPAPINNAIYMDSVQISPDGRQIVGSVGNEAFIVDLDSGLRQTVPLTGRGVPIAWSPDGLGIYFMLTDQSPSRIVRADWRTGSVENWKTLATSGRSEFAGLASGVAAPSANAYAYSTNYYLSRLYVVDGWL